MTLKYRNLLTHSHLLPCHHQVKQPEIKKNIHKNTCDQKQQQQQQKPKTLNDRGKLLCSAKLRQKFEAKIIENHGQFCENSSNNTNFDLILCSGWLYVNLRR